MDHPPHDDDMQAYFPPQDHQWADPMHIDDHAEAVPWNYGCSGASNWWLPQDSHDQFNHLPAFPPQQGGPWSVDQYPPAHLDFQGAHFHPPTFEPDQLIPDDELDGLLNPHPSNPQAGLELGRPEHQARQRVRQRISSPAKAILQQWFDDHIEDPYLEREDVSTLSEATGLTPRQVRTFFANARARKLPAPLPGQPSPPALSSTEAKASGAPSNKPKQPASRPPRPRQQSPMQRYLSSSPEDEGVCEETLRHAAAASSSTQANTGRIGSAPHRNPDALSEAASSNSSSSSRASIDSAVNRVPRRGRKRHRGSLRRSNTVVRERIDQSKIFQCTFCNRDFAQKYDWRRHEESVHIPQKEWICMPDGPVRTDDDTGFRFCVFCDQPNPSHDHLQRHNHAPCLSAPQASRTFTRKDKLIQHLGQVHKQAQMSATMQSWCRRVSRNIAIACGICGVRLFTWNERVEHISTHFIDGLDMRYWLGAPGGVVSLSPPPAAAATHHHHHRCGGGPSTSSSSSSSLSSSSTTAAVDPLFPAYTPLPPRSAHASSSTSSFSHSCTSCSNRFSRYSDTVFHERQVHRLYKPRPQPTEDGGNIANPLPQQQSHEEQQSGLDVGRGATTTTLPSASSGQQQPRRGRGRGPVASLMQRHHQQQLASVDAPVAAVLWGGGSGSRSKALLGEDGGEKGNGGGRPFWRDSHH